MTQLTPSPEFQLSYPASHPKTSMQQSSNCSSSISTFDYYYGQGVQVLPFFLKCTYIYIYNSCVVPFEDGFLIKSDITMSEARRSIVLRGEGGIFFCNLSPFWWPKDVEIFLKSALYHRLCPTLQMCPCRSLTALGLRAQCIKKTVTKDSHLLSSFLVNREQFIYK